MTTILIAACLLLLGLLALLAVMLSDLRRQLAILKWDRDRMVNELRSLRSDSGPFVNHDFADDPITRKPKRQKPYAVTS